MIPDAISALIARVKKEPAVLLGVANAVIAIALAFGLDLTTEQQGLILAGVSGLIAFLVRAQVTPVSSIPAPPVDPPTF